MLCILALGFIDIVIALVATFCALELLVSAAIILLFVYKLFLLIVDSTDLQQLVVNRRMQNVSVSVSLSDVHLISSTPATTASIVQLGHRDDDVDANRGRAASNMSCSSHMSLLQQWQSFASIILINTITQHTLLAALLDHVYGVRL